MMRETLHYLLAITALVFCAANPVPPRRYVGTYHPDRWNVQQFDGIEVSIAKDLVAEFAPHRGWPVLVEATKIWDGLPGDPAVIYDIAWIKRLPSPVDLQVTWGDGRGDYRQLEPAMPIKLAVTLKNTSGEVLDLNKISLWLRLYRPRPSGPGSYSLDSYYSYKAHLARKKMLPQDQTIVARHVPSVLGPPPEAPTLKEEESLSWTVVVEKLPVNEYEIGVEAAQYNESLEQHVHVVSNALRLDVLGNEPIPWQGLEVHLEPDPGRDPPAGGGTPMVVRFKSKWPPPLHMVLPYVGFRRNASEMLVCYDREGTQIPLEKPEGETVYWRVRLRQEEELTIPAVLPPGTRTARVAFQHQPEAAAPQGKKPPGEILLDSDVWLYSPHVVLSEPSDK